MNYRKGPCGKITYLKIEWARYAIQRQYGRFAEIMFSYWCGKCIGYHLTRKKCKQQ